MRNEKKKFKKSLPEKNSEKEMKRKWNPKWRTLSHLASGQAASHHLSLIELAFLELNRSTVAQTAPAALSKHS